MWAEPEETGGFETKECSSCGTVFTETVRSYASVCEHCISAESQDTDWYH